MATEPAYGWGIQRPEVPTGKPFLLDRFYARKKEAVEAMLCIYGDHPNRKAALKRLTREGIFVVRVVLRRFASEAKGAT